MNTKLLTCALGAALVLPAAAVLQLGGAKLNSNLGSELSKRDNIAATNFAKTANGRIADAAERPAQKVVGAIGEENFPELDKFGKLHLLIEEDFSKIKTGSIEEPDFDVVLDHPVLYENDEPVYPDYPYPWWNFRHEYIHTPHWGVGNAYPAGECLMFDCKEVMGQMGEPYVEQAHINTPLADVSKYDGIAVLEFKARSKETNSLYNGLLVEAADTRHMGPTWDNMESPIYLEKIPSTWTTYRFIFQGGNESVIFNIVGMEKGQVYIDDVKVYGLEQTVKVPTMLPHTDYKGTSFVAHWTASEGASHYLLTCYSQAEDGTPTYLLQDVACEDNSRLIDNAVDGETYFLSVKACHDKYESIPSLENYVYDLTVPVMNPVVKESDWVYKASWSDVASAEVYNYWAYNDRVAKEDGVFVVTDENFDGVTDANGELTGWQMFDGHDGSYYAKHYPKTLKQQGWMGTNYAPLTDCICVDVYPWYYGHNENQASFQCEEMDMSKDGGKFEVSVKLAGEEISGYDAEGKELTLPVKAAIALFTYDEEKGEMVQAERHDIEDLTREFKEYTIKFTKGTERSIIGIFGYNAPGDLCIDDLKITQNYKKGEKLREAFLFDQYHGAFNGADPTEITVEVPYWASDCEIYHKVSAVKQVVEPYYGTILYHAESAYSDMEYATVTPYRSGITNVQLNLGRAWSNGKQIMVENPDGVAVSIYSVNGICICNSNEKNFAVTPGANGVYVVKLGNQTIKINF